MDDDVLDEAVVPPPAYAKDDEETHAPKVAAKAVKNHEKRMQRALKDAELARVAKERIAPLLPKLYEQLENALFHPDVKTKNITFDGKYIDIRFRLKGVDPEMLERYLPKMFAAYAKQVEIAGIRESRDRAIHSPGSAGLSDAEIEEALRQASAIADTAQAMADAQDHATTSATNRSAAIPDEPPISYEEAERAFGSPTNLSRQRTADTTLPTPTAVPTDRPHSLDIQDARSRQHCTYISGHRIKASRISVQRSYFNAYTQKIYFSRRYVDMWRKKDPQTGRREALPGAIAMLIVGAKVGLPLFDLVTFAVLDLPRLAMQGITNQHIMSVRR